MGDERSPWPWLPAAPAGAPNCTWAMTAPGCQISVTHGGLKWLPWEAAHNRALFRIFEIINGLIKTHARLSACQEYDELAGDWGLLTGGGGRLKPNGAGGQGSKQGPRPFSLHGGREGAAGLRGLSALRGRVDGGGGGGGEG